MDSCIYFDSKRAAGVCLGTIKPALMFSWRLHVSGQCFAPNTGYGLPCNTCTVTLGIWVMNVPIMPLHMVHLPLGTTLPLAGFVITLTHLPVVMVVTASARFWKDCIALEQMQRRYLKMGVSAVFIIGFFVSLRHAFVTSVFLLSALFPRAFTLLFRKGNGKPNFVSSSGENFAHNIWNPLLDLLFHEQISGVFVLYVEEIDLAKIALLSFCS